MKVRLPSRINLKIISATSVVLFTLLVSFIGVYSWFQSINGVRNTGDNFIIENTGATVSEVKFYPLDSIENKTYKFSTTAIATASIEGGTATIPASTLALGTYKPETPHHPILMLIKISGSTMNISASTLSNTTQYITDKTYGEGDANIPPQEDNPLSSVIQFHTVGFSSDENDDTSLNGRTSADTISIKENELQNTNQSSFAVITNGEKTGFRQEITIFEGVVDTYGYVGVVIDYYPESVQFIYSYYMGRAVDILEYVCDWRMSL